MEGARLWQEGEDLSFPHRRISRLVSKESCSIPPFTAIERAGGGAGTDKVRLESEPCVLLLDGAADLLTGLSLPQAPAEARVVQEARDARQGLEVLAFGVFRHRQ